ncbi:MAG: hypothetical protein KA368_14230 [Acidobacteria bacterium]|nr:hypothetical protein [Acidobacteriota bacterium]
MATMTAETILQLVDQLTPFEQKKFRQLLEQREPMPTQPKSETQPQRNGASTNHLNPIPMPDGKPERAWLAANRHQYAGQWVALDGSRLIAASKDHDEVWAAADADGAYLPLITFVENPDQITHIIWT